MKFNLTILALTLIISCGDEKKSPAQENKTFSDHSEKREGAGQNPADNYEPVTTTPPSDTLSSEAVVKPESQPEFEGGNENLSRMLSNEIRYPTIAKENGIEGKVFISFVIDKTGTMRDVKVIKSVSPELDREAVRALKTCNRWKPGIMNGKPVNVKLVLPVNFKLK